jgi:hypothetical protein
VEALRTDHESSKSLEGVRGIIADSEPNLFSHYVPLYSLSMNTAEKVNSIIDWLEEDAQMLRKLIKDASHPVHQTVFASKMESDWNHLASEYAWYGQKVRRPPFMTYFV